MSIVTRDYEVTAIIRIRGFFPEDSLYDNHTKQRVLDMIASDIRDGWMTASNYNVDVKFREQEHIYGISGGTGTD